MSEKIDKAIKELIDGTGALVELWIINYQMFRDKGMDEATAFKHTRELMLCMLMAADRTRKNEAEES